LENKRQKAELEEAGGQPIKNKKQRTETNFNFLLSPFLISFLRFQLYILSHGSPQR